MITLNVAEEFSDTPGGRFIKDGPDSGEEFRKLLQKKHEEAKNRNTILKVNLDGVYGYTTPFLDESFGILGESTRSLKQDIEFISKDQPDLPSIIKELITERQHSKLKIERET